MANGVRRADEQDDASLLAIGHGSDSSSSDGGLQQRAPRAATPLWLLMVLYVATALVQPTLTDEIRYSGGAGHVGWPPTLLAMMANTLAMATLMVFAGRSLRGTLCARGKLDRTSLRLILLTTALDFVSGMLLTTGLLMLGSGLFVVIYSSTTAWTALWARCTGQKLSAGRWVGVLLVSGGMVVSASSNIAEASGDAQATANIVVGCAVLLAGTVLHAAMFVQSELVIRQAGIDLLVLCASMGTIETALLLLWNVSLLAAIGPSLYVSVAEDGALDSSPQHLLLLYAALTLVNAVHAWAFFNMLEKVGAVSSAVMKGLQLVLVSCFSFVFFCRYQETQCFSVSKASGVAAVAVGLLVYARSTAPSRSDRPAPPRKLTKDPDPHTVI